MAGMSVNKLLLHNNRSCDYFNFSFESKKKKKKARKPAWTDQFVNYLYEHTYHFLCFKRKVTFMEIDIIMKEPWWYVTCIFILKFDESHLWNHHNLKIYIKEKGKG